MILGAVDQVLREGNTGRAVTQLQTSLKMIGYDPGVVDGSFGPRTRAAVEVFQQAQDLPVNGTVAPATQTAIAQALEAMSAVKTAVPPPPPTLPPAPMALSAFPPVQVPGLPFYKQPWFLLVAALAAVAALKAALFPDKPARFADFEDTAGLAAEPDDGDEDEDEDEDDEAPVVKGRVVR